MPQAVEHGALQLRSLWARVRVLQELAAAEEEVEVEEAEDTEPLDFDWFEHSGGVLCASARPAPGWECTFAHGENSTPEDRCLDGGDHPLCGVQGKKVSGCDCLWLYCGFWKYFSYFLVLLCPW